MSMIPVRCVSCGKVLGDKYRFYLEEVIKIKTKNKITDSVTYYSIDMLDKPIEKSTEALVLDKLKITNDCCRRHMLTQPK